MPKTTFQSVDEYIKSFSVEEQRVLQAMRKCIADAVPEAEEVISYQMPAFKYHGWIFYMSAYSNHYAISCPPPFTVFNEFATPLEKYEVSKSAIKFPKNQPVPLELIGEMADFRARENKARNATKAEKK